MANPNGITKDALMEQFAVMSLENHGGTFNGCLEAIHLTLEGFVKQKTRELVPGILLDYRTSLGKCLDFLRGNSKNFLVLQPDGQYREQRIPAPPNGIFTAPGGEFLDDLIEERNNHSHVASNYPVIASFQNIRLAVGDQVLVFNPATESKIFVIEQGEPRFRDEVCLLHIRDPLPNENVDMEECDEYHRDLCLECLTEKEFTSDAKDKGLQIPPFGSATHALVVYYGKKKFFAYIKRREYDYLHQLFAYSPKDRWRTHYFRFRAQSLLDRLLARH